MLNELVEDNLNAVVLENERVVIQYGAAWCGACRIMKPKMKRLSNEYEQVSFYYVDAEKYPDSRKLANVSNLPTFASFKNGKLVGQIQSNKEDALKILINEIADN